MLVASPPGQCHATGYYCSRPRECLSRVARPGAVKQTAPGTSRSLLHSPPPRTLHAKNYRDKAKGGALFRHRAHRRRGGHRCSIPPSAVATKPASAGEGIFELQALFGEGVELGRKLT